MFHIHHNYYKRVGLDGTTLSGGVFVGPVFLGKLVINFTIVLYYPLVCWLGSKL